MGSQGDQCLWFFWGYSKGSVSLHSVAKWKPVQTEGISPALIGNLQSQQIVTNPTSIFIVNMPWVSFGKMKGWHKGYNWATKKNAAQWIDLFFSSFPSVRPCQVTIEDFFINIWVFSVWYWNSFFSLFSLFCYLLSSISNFASYTNLLTFSIRRIWNLGASSYHDRRDCRQTDTCSLHPLKEGLNNVTHCPWDRYILPYWNM